MLEEREVNGSDLGLCLLTDLDVSGVESWGFTARLLIIKYK
jgi:hypothetical protein